MHTLTRTTLRELVADTLRDHRAESPGDCADRIMDVLKTYAPKAFVEGERDIEPGDERLQNIAAEMIKAHAFDISTWEINAAYGHLSEDEVQCVDDMIGMASIEISF